MFSMGSCNIVSRSFNPFAFLLFAPITAFHLLT